MLSARLVRMIEDHVDPLTLGVINDLQANPRVESSHKLSSDKLHRSSNVLRPERSVL